MLNVLCPACWSAIGFGLGENDLSSCTAGGKAWVPVGVELLNWKICVPPKAGDPQTRPLLESLWRSG